MKEDGMKNRDVDLLGPRVRFFAWLYDSAGWVWPALGHPRPLRDGDRMTSSIDPRWKWTGEAEAVLDLDGTTVILPPAVLWPRCWRWLPFLAAALLTSSSPGRRFVRVQAPKPVPLKDADQHPIEIRAAVADRWRW